MTEHWRGSLKHLIIGAVGHLQGLPATRLLLRPAEYRCMGSSRSTGTKLIVGAAGGGVCALGVAVLIGWQIHSPLLVQVVPTLDPMTPMTALSFVLSGIAMLL